MDDVIQLQDRFYILATSSLLQERRRVLKDGDSFAVFDTQGDIAPFGTGEQGYFHGGTRHLSLLRQTINGRRPLLLSSRVREQNDLFGADLTNPDQVREGSIVFPRDLLHIFRARFLWEGHWYERLRVSNYGLVPITATLMFEFAADYADIFEVRGVTRRRRGRLLPNTIEPHGLRLAYEGLDGATRATVVLLDPVPELPAPDRACFQVDLPPHASETFTIIIRCEGPEGCGQTQTYEAAWEAAARRGDQQRSNWCTLFTANEQFNEWCNRSAADLQMMTSELATGPYAYAGVPWFSTPFGRDGIITALEGLWANPDLARGTLAYLASTQARTARDNDDAEPGKILHEARAGEMARLREVPFGCYYGIVDATPLFVILAGCYYARTGDRDFIAGIWEHVDRALGWIDQYGDRDGDGFVEYARRSPTGLVHQGWKDSSDSVMHADGTLAEAPIALCEVGAGPPGRGPARTVRGGVLVRRLRHVRARAGRRQAPLPCADVERGALPPRGHSRPGPCRARRRHAARRDALLGVGCPDAGDDGGPLQPDVVPQRVDLAARQRDHRGGPRTLRPARANRAHSRRPLRRQSVHRSAADARALLRLPPPGGRRAHALPGRLLAAVVVGGRGVHAARRDGRPDDRRPRAADYDYPRHAAGVPAAGAVREPAAR